MMSLTASQSSQSSEIEWPPTPPRDELTGAQKRLRDIEDALAEVPGSEFLGFDRNNVQVIRSSSKLGSSTIRNNTLARVFLTKEQQQILKLVNEGESLFYTGSAGTGKSILLREIIKTLRKNHAEIPDAIAVTASTGIAACNIGGITIHSFAGIGLGRESLEELAVKVKNNHIASNRWLRTKALVIDEISMVDGDLFDKLSRLGSIIRKRTEPFGGLQVVVTGDFFQLPPVVKEKGKVKFAFEAASWEAAIKHTYNLTKVFRQKDQHLVRMLDELRYGCLSKTSIAKFKGLSRPIESEDGVTATELFPLRRDVNRANECQISRLNSETVEYPSIDGGLIQDKCQKLKLLSNFMAPHHLTLRIDAQVMLIKNVDEILVNGSMGRVVRFIDPAAYDPDKEHVEDSSVIGSVALVEAAKRASTVHSGVGISTRLFPIVEFATLGGRKREILVLPEVWKLELPNGEIQVCRTQLPLILAWAMSIHKSQGQTLDRVKVDLAKVFETGQAYVALSRATSLEGLQVLNFDAKKVKADPKVITWSQTLKTVEDNQVNTSDEH